MKSTRLLPGPPSMWAVVFDAGDEVAAGLAAFAAEHRLDAASFTAIGGFSRATLGYFDVEEQCYVDVEVDEQVEVVSLVGDVAASDEGPVVHAHVVVSDRQGQCRGGHLRSATVRPTLEVVLQESPAHLRRRFDPASGLALIDIDASTALGSGPSA